MDEVQEQLDYWKKVVAEHEDQGLKVWGPDDFEAGEWVLAQCRSAVILKVNPKTLRVKFNLEWMNALDITKVPYDALSQNCKEVA
jgi:ribosomal silencing factor RsfS